MSKDKRTFDLEERLIDFAVRIIRIAESLPKTKIGNHIAGQLIRSGTSPAPNYGEAQGAESRSDFIHKMKVERTKLRHDAETARLATRTHQLQAQYLPAMHREDMEPTASMSSGRDIWKICQLMIQALM